MKTTKRIRRKSRREWAAIIEAQVTSGETAGIYCREHDIPYKSFLYNRRKIRQCEAVSPRASTFIPVRVSSTSRISLRMSSGVVLESERFPDVDWLIDLTRRLAGGEKIS